MEEIKGSLHTRVFVDIALTIFINGHFTDSVLDHTTTART